MLADIVCTCTIGNQVVASSGSLSSLAKQIENGTLQQVCDLLVLHIWQYTNFGFSGKFPVFLGW